MPLGSNFRLNIDFPVVRKILSGNNYSSASDSRQNLPYPANLAWLSGQITPLFEKYAEENSRKSAEIPCVVPIHYMANKYECRRPQERFFNEGAQQQ
jgi:hypothetical protein